MSVGWSVGLSVGLWVTKTKSEHFLAIPLLPTRPQLGGVYTALLTFMGIMKAVFQLAYFEHLTN